MVIDTSALVAILLGEPDSPKYEEAIDKDPTLLISAASVLEVSIVLVSRFGETGERELDLLLHRAPFQVVDVTAEQVELARHAFRTYGRGQHAAGLNYGDCFSYALSKMSGQPLLFKGQDFAKTDIRSPLP